MTRLQNLPMSGLLGILFVLFAEQCPVSLHRMMEAFGKISHEAQSSYLMCDWRQVMQARTLQSSWCGVMCAHLTALHTSSHFFP